MESINTNLEEFKSEVIGYARAVQAVKDKKRSVRKKQKAARRINRKR